MAKKKSVSKEEAPKEITPQTEDNSGENASEDDSVKTSSEEAVELDKTEILSTLDFFADEGAAASGDDGAEALHSTGEVSVEGKFEDSQVLTRLRTVALTPSEIYREAQLFHAQNLDVTALLKSTEPVLIQNIVDILRMLDIWNAEAIPHVVDEDARTFECVTRYISHCFKMGLVHAVDVVDRLAQIPSGKSEALAAFADKFSAVLVAVIGQNQDPDLLADAMPAFTKLCVYLDSKVLSRLLYDPEPNVRIGVLRSYALRGSIDVNDLSVALILLKDKDEQVNIAVMRMISRFAIFPELVIPQLLLYVQDASNELRAEIVDVFRSYGNAAVESVILSLDNPREDVFRAAQYIIAQMPQRYTDGLLKGFVSVRTKNLAKERITNILRTHQDPGRREEIQGTLHTYLKGLDENYPEWKAPDTTVYFIDKAIDDEAVYERVLSDDELPALSKKCNDEILGRLLGDATDIPRINALNVIRYRKEASPAIRFEMLVWLKSTSPEVAKAALDAYLTTESDTEKTIAIMLDAFEHGESSDVKKNFFDVIMRHQESIDALIRAFYQTPKKCSNFIVKFLAIGPSPATLEAILHGIDRDKTAVCVSETLNALLRTQIKFDDKKMRPELIRHIREPLTFGHYGFLTRLYSLKLLQLYLSRDEARDSNVISQLQAFYKEARNTDLKTLTKTILKELGEEIFDFDDEEDDFEDLREEDEEEED